MVAPETLQAGTSHRTENKFLSGVVEQLRLSDPFRKYGGIRAAMYPLSLRCSSVKYDKGIRPPRALRKRRLAALDASPYLRTGPLVGVPVKSKMLQRIAIDLRGAPL